MRIKSWYAEILIFFFFALLSLIVTYPLIFRMRSYLYGLGGDSLGSVHGFWWFKYAYLNHISPHLNSITASPFGVDYSYSPPLLVIFFGKWLSIFVNEIFAYNFILLPTFLLSSLTMYFLVHYFTKNRLASLIASFIYAFSPFHFAHAFCHIPQTNIQWMPLYALLLFKLDEERSYRSALFCALIFSLNVFTDYEYGYFMAVFTVAFVVWRGWFGLRRKSKVQSPKSPSSEAALLRRTGKANRKDSLLHTCKVVVVAVVVAVAIILPFTYSTLKTALFAPKTEEIMSKGYVRPFRDLISNSARPLGYLLPSQNNPFFGGFTKKFIKNPLYGGHPTEHTLYLGWVGIVLSIVAVRAWRRKNALMRNAERVMRENRINASTHQRINASRIKDQGSRIQRGVSFFLFAGIVALIFSHSPWTEIGPFRIFFPSYFMYKVLPMFRCYARFGIVVMLCVSVLAGIGLASILGKIRGTKKRRVFFSVVLLLIFIEFAPTLPAPMVDAVNPPSVYEWITKQEGDFTIVEYPLETDYEYLFWQRIHQKRLVNGAQPGTYADKVRKEIVDILKPETPGILSYLGAKYVIFHPDKYLKSEDVPVIGEVPDVSKQGGLKLVKTFEEARVYEVIARPQRPQSEP